MILLYNFMIKFDKYPDYQEQETIKTLWNLAKSN